MNKRKVYQPPEGLIFWLDAGTNLLETQSYPGMIDADFAGFSDPKEEDEWR